MELLYLGVLTDGEEYELSSVNTLRHPLDLLDAISVCRQSQIQTAAQHSIRLVEVFAFCGTEVEVRALEDLAKAEVQRVIQRTADGESFHTETPTIGSETTNQFFKLYLDTLYGDRGLLFPAVFPLKDDTGVHLLCFSYCQMPSEIGLLEVTVNSVVGDWIENEQCTLLGKQVLTRPFLLNGLRGRRIIAPMFDPERKTWTLLTDGARIVPLSERASSFAEKYSEIMTDGSLASIVLNPAFGFGVCFDCWDLIEDWTLAMLYLVSITSLDRAWSTADLVSLYDRFIEMMKGRFPYSECECLVSKETVVEVALRMVANLKMVVQGSDSFFERDYLQRMKYRQYHLSRLASLFEAERPGCLHAVNRPSVFERNRYCELLRLCSAGNTYSRGKALETLAEYFFSSLPGWRLVDNRILSFNGEMDLAYCNTSLRLPHWNMGAVLLVECKNLRQPADISVLRNFYYLMQSKGLFGGFCGLLPNTGQVNNPR